MIFKGFKDRVRWICDHIMVARFRAAIIRGQIESTYIYWVTPVCPNLGFILYLFLIINIHGYCFYLSVSDRENKAQELGCTDHGHRSRSASPEATMCLHGRWDPFLSVQPFLKLRDKAEVTVEETGVAGD